MELILIDMIEGALVSRVSGVCSPSGCPCVARGEVSRKELGDRTSTEGGEMAASSRAARPGHRCPHQVRPGPQHRAAGYSCTGASGCGCCLCSGFVRSKHEGKQEAEDTLPASQLVIPTGGHPQLAAILGRH